MKSIADWLHATFDAEPLTQFNRIIDAAARRVWRRHRHRQHIFTAGLSDSLPPNYYSLYGSYAEQQSLTTGASAPTKSLGVNFTYSRDIRPDVNGYASLGVSNSVNSPTVVPGTTTVNFSQTTSYNNVYATVGLNTVLGRTLTGSIIYTFSYNTNGTVLAGGRNGDVFVNQLQFLLSKTF